MNRYSPIKITKLIFKNNCFVLLFTFLFNGLNQISWQLLPALLIRNYISKITVATHSNSKDIFNTLFFVLLIFILSFVSDIGYTIFKNKFLKRLQIYLRTNILALMSESPCNIKITNYSEYYSRIRFDLEKIAHFFFDLFSCLLSVICLAISIYLMFSVSFTIIVFGITPIVISISILIFRILPLIKLRHLQTKESIESSNLFFKNSIDNILIIKLLAIKQHFIDVSINIFNYRLKCVLREAFLFSCTNIIQRLSPTIGIGLVLVFIYKSIATGRVIISDLSLVIYLLGMIGNLITSIGDIFIDYRHFSISISRITSIFDQNDDLSLFTRRKNIPNHIANEASLLPIVIKNATYHYKTTKKGFKNIDLTVTKKSFTVITGALGTGKTTLVKTILGLINLDYGTITYNGNERQTLFWSDTIHLIGYVPQNPYIFNTSIKDNIIFGDKKALKILDYIMRITELTKEIDKLPQGINTIIEENGKNLSGGQIQRIVLARALIRQPQLLILDDATSGIDYFTEQRIISNLKSLENITILFISQRNSILHNATHILRL